MTLRFSRHATNQLANIREYLIARKPESAELVRGRILATIARLHELPRMGHTGTVAGTRELAAAGLPYVIVYRNDIADELVILGVSASLTVGTCRGPRKRSSHGCGETAGCCVPQVEKCCPEGATFCTDHSGLDQA